MPIGRVISMDVLVAMNTYVLATNDPIPPEDSPLMSRFITSAIHDKVPRAGVFFRYGNGGIVYQYQFQPAEGWFSLDWIE